MSETLLGWRGRLVGELRGDVLEIGAGTGANFAHYRRARTVVAVEPDEERATKARKAAERATKRTGIPLRVIAAPAEEMPFPVNTFDNAVSSLVFCSVADQNVALEEIARVLRPEGVLWLVEHIRPDNQIAARAAEAVTPYWRRVAHNCHLDRDTPAVLRAAGWKVDVLRRTGILVKMRATAPV